VLRYPDTAGDVAFRASTAWTDHGTARQERGLKHRAAHETRTIPLPLELVRLLRAHIKRYGTSPDEWVLAVTHYCDTFVV
jgi:hypothetical protein